MVNVTVTIRGVLALFTVISLCSLLSVCFIFLGPALSSCKYVAGKTGQLLLISMSSMERVDVITASPEFTANKAGRCHNTGGIASNLI